MNYRNLVLITDVNSPYRDHLFSRLYKTLEMQDVSLIIYFMRSSSKIRKWSNQTLKKNYLSIVSKGIVFSIGMHEFHFNIDIIKFVLKNKKDHNFIIGGSWNSPTNLIISLLIKLKILNKNNFYLWSESNYKSFIFKNKLVVWLRKLVFSQFNSFIIPSQIAKKSIKLILNQNKKVNFLFLPNIINEKKFVKNEKDIKNNQIIAFWPARLHENSKGIINFLSKVKKIIFESRLKIFIAGDGPDKDKIKKYIIDHKLDKNVFLLGYLNEKEIINKYNSSDFFLLPSLRDPCPLSVIEALWMSKPILISNHCGNIKEALKPHSNGFSFDPNNSNSIKKSLLMMLNLTSSEFKKFGKVSLDIANKRFNSEICVNNFVKNLIRK